MMLTIKQDYERWFYTAAEQNLLKIEFQKY